MAKVRLLILFIILTMLYSCGEYERTIATYYIYEKKMYVTLVLDNDYNILIFSENIPEHKKLDVYNYDFIKLSKRGSFLSLLIPDNGCDTIYVSRQIRNHFIKTTVSNGSKEEIYILDVQNISPYIKELNIKKYKFKLINGDDSHYIVAEDDFTRFPKAGYIELSLDYIRERGILYYLTLINHNGSSRLLDPIHVSGNKDWVDP